MVGTLCEGMVGTLCEGDGGGYNNKGPTMSKLISLPCGHTISLMSCYHNILTSVCTNVHVHVSVCMHTVYSLYSSESEELHATCTIMHALMTGHCS